MAAPRRAQLVGDGEFGYHVAGTGRYQQELEQIAGRSEEGAYLDCAALVVPEPDNRHDRNAVAVYVRGEKIGYLPRSDAPELLAVMSENGVDQAVCAARIVGG